MFQKSFQILTVCALATLAAIVGYAALRLNGPEDTLARAEAKFAAGNFGEVVSDLDLAQRGARFARSPELQARLWRLRYQAFAALDDPTSALEDLRPLLERVGDAEPELLLDEIRLLARADEGELARQRGRAFCEAHPEDSRALELTGEACQSAYQQLLRELQVKLEHELGQRRRAAARKALLAYLYRPAGDGEVTRAIAKLEEMYASEPRLRAAWPDVSAQADDLRVRVQEGLSFFERSLALGGEPVAAFRAVATAYEQSGRLDDLFFACEIQRRMFDHAYVPESGAWAAWARLQTALPAAALQTVDRWLKVDDVEAYAQAGTLSTASEDLALARALASWQLRDRAEIGKSVALAVKLRAFELGALPALWAGLAGMRTLHSTPNPVQAADNLQRLLKVALSRPAPLYRPDLAAEFAPALLDNLLQNSAPEPEVLAMLASWRAGRPESPEPHLATANYLRSLGRTAAALAALSDAEKVAPEDQRMFPLRVELSQQHYAPTSQSGPNLLAQCAQNRRALPEVEDPIGYVLCAEAALQQPEALAAQIALVNARAAVGAFPQANLPRQLELRALLAQGRTAEAVEVADLTVRSVVPDAATLQLAIDAKRRAGVALRDLALVAMPRVASNLALQIELLRIAVEDAPTTATQYLRPEMLVPDAPLDARALGALALARAGRVEEAEAALAKLGPQRADGDRALVMAAFTGWLSARAERTDDAALCADAGALRDALGLDDLTQEPLLDAAAALADSHPKTARTLLLRSLSVASADERTGARYALLGALSADQDDLRAAKAAWLAALGFPDRGEAAERLARYYLLEGDEPRAARAYALVDAPTDAALAARMGRLQIGGALLAQQLKLDAADLVAHATLATFGQVSLVDWEPPTDPEVLAQRLELLSCLADPALAAFAVPRAKEMADAAPEARTHRLLLAHALADADDGAGAAAQHAPLLRGVPPTAILLREVAYASGVDGYALDDGLRLRVVDAISKGGAAGSPMTLRFGATSVIASFEAGGFTDAAKKTRLTQLLATPNLQPWTQADLALITESLPPQQACITLHALLSGPHAGDRDALLAAYYRLAPAALEGAPQIEEALVAIAAQHLKSDGAQAQIVHFLLDHPVDGVALQTEAMLVAHLERVARAEDGSETLRASADRLVEAVGVARSEALVHALLESYPTSLPLWALQTKLRAQMLDGAEALAALRRVLSHAVEPGAELSFLALAGAEHSLTEADIERLAALPDELLGTPAGRYVQAVFALRQGQPDAAREHFAAAAPQVDGRHLFLWALADLESEAGTVEQAQARLQQLLADYPSSSWARHAGSFVRQLSPR